MTPSFRSHPDPNTQFYSYQLATALSYSSLHASTLALIKRTPTLDPLTPLASQLHLLNLFGPSSNNNASAGGVGAGGESTGTPYESLHQLVHWGVGPWFEAFVSSRSGANDGGATRTGKGGKAEDGKMGEHRTLSLPQSTHLTILFHFEGIPMTKKKFAELELSLLHLQQNVEIPDTTLAIHPVVQRAVEKVRLPKRSQPVSLVLTFLGVPLQCRFDSTRVTVDAISPPSLLIDASFLNKLQSDVNSWIKEIQSVTKLDRDVSSGTASQEINFWLSMERALEGIASQLNSESVTLALDILKHAKRFHATVSFISDTGLEEAMSRGSSPSLRKDRRVELIFGFSCLSSRMSVHSYNQLMKDFPLNDLLSATDLERMKDSLVLIFKHLQNKLKLSFVPRPLLSFSARLEADFASFSYLVDPTPSVELSRSSRPSPRTLTTRSSASSPVRSSCTWSTRRLRRPWSPVKPSSTPGTT